MNSERVVPPIWCLSLKTSGWRGRYGVRYFWPKSEKSDGTMEIGFGGSGLTYSSSRSAKVNFFTLLGSIGYNLKILL